MSLISIVIDQEAGGLKSLLDSEELSKWSNEDLGKLIEHLETVRSELLSRILGTRSRLGLVVDVTFSTTILTMRESFAFHPNAESVLSELINSLVASKHTIQSLKDNRH